MPNQRSPNCPHITFAEAAEKGRLVYKSEHRHPSHREVVAKSLGYSSINGRSLSIIGALRQYGILEGSGEALRVSDSAVSYFELGPREEAGATALLDMVFHPPFFAQIRDAFGDNLPSEQNLKHYLIKEGFLPKAAEEVINVYRQNMLLVEESVERYSEASLKMKETSITVLPTTSQASPQNVSDAKSVVTTTWFQNYSFPLSKDSRAELQIRGEITNEALDLLRDHIALVIRALRSQTKEKIEQASDEIDELDRMDPRE